ncbi:hypothetical protein ACFWBF_34435 [Streptomyces sp. NPDC060028]|uniref:hypothetical protein n=1 Tax=Streptomyces sp. NPDC060028 TaxID=3347041 RepID=UPI0036B9F522
MPGPSGVGVSIPTLRPGPTRRTPEAGSTRAQGPLRRRPARGAVRDLVARCAVGGG